MSNGLGTTIPRLVVAVQVGESDCLDLLIALEPWILGTLPDGFVEVDK